MQTFQPLLNESAIRQAACSRSDHGRGSSSLMLQQAIVNALRPLCLHYNFNTAIAAILTLQVLSLDLITCKVNVSC